MKGQRERSDSNVIPLSEPRRFGDSLAVEERPVLAAQVFEDRFLLVQHDSRVIAGDPERLEPYRRRGIAAEYVLAVTQLDVAIFDA